MKNTPDQRPVQDRRPLWWLAGVLFLLAIAGAAYWLGGTGFWKWTAGIATAVLILGLLGLTREGVLSGLRAEEAVVCAYIVLVWACWVGIGFFLGVSRVEVKRDWGQPRAGQPYLPTRVRYAGRVVAAFTDKPSCTFEVRRFCRDLLVVEMQRPDGWVECDLTGDSTAVQIKKRPTATLYIDNRRHQAVEVSCGQLRIAVSAGAAVCRTILAPPRGGQYPLLLDGRAIGEPAGEHCLVDVVGARTYRFQSLIYARSGFDAMTWGDRPAPEGHYSGRHLHKVPGKVDYFLTPAPRSLTVRRLKGFSFLPEKRAELLEAD
jgi:hypothetical protein